MSPVIYVHGLDVNDKQASYT